MRYPGFLRTFGSRLGAGLADELLDRWFPRPPSFLDRLREACIEAVPAALQILAKMDYGKPPTSADVARAVAPEVAPPSLGQFTCPKCGGHTWSTMGLNENGTYLRYCTNGLETAYGDFNTNTVATPCMFKWKATEDHLYFAKPSADEAKRATETQVCVPPEPRPKVRWSPDDPTCESPGGCASSRADHLADWDRGVDWGRPVLGITPNAVEDVYAALVRAIGDRFESAEESLCHAAVRILRDVFPEGGGYPDHRSLLKLGSGPIRTLISLSSLRCLAEAMGDRANGHSDIIFAASNLITEADAFIKQQSDKIADLMLDNVFPAGKGEIGFMLTADMAKKIGLRCADNAPPIRVALVLDGWQWAVRLGLGRVGGELIKVDWAKADELLRDAKTAWMCSGQTEMAQNAAGGVA